MRDAHFEALMKKLKEHSVAFNEKTLENIYDEMRASKSQLDEVLGLNAENNYRIIIDYKISDTRFRMLYPKLYAFIKSNSDNNKFSVTKNEIIVGKENWKLTTYIKKKLDNGEIIINSSLIESFNGELEGSSDIISRIQELSKQRKLVISTNIYDFFTSSTDSVYTSCYRMNGGEHFNGNIAYARDNFTVICYIFADDITRKIGRSWSYIFMDQLKLVMSNKPYGCIFKSDRKEFRSQILKHISNSKRISHKWKVVEHLEYKDGTWFNARPSGSKSYSVYFDYGSMSLSYHKAHSNNIIPIIEFRNSRCLSCGTVTDKPSKGHCGKCIIVSTRCSHCNEIISQDNRISVGGRYFCQDCYDTHMLECYSCGDPVYDILSRTYQNDVYCPECFDENYFQCNVCENIFENDRGQYVESEEAHVCSSCLDNDFAICEECNMYHRYTYEVDGRCYCEECRNEYLYICASCEDYFTSLKETSDGIDVCENCYAEHYTSCVECESEIRKKDAVILDGTYCIDCHDKRVEHISAMENARRINESLEVVNPVTVTEVCEHKTPDGEHCQASGVHSCTNCIDEMDPIVVDIEITQRSN